MHSDGVHDRPAAAGVQDIVSALRTVALFEASKGILAALAAFGVLTLGPDGLRRVLEWLLEAVHLAALRGHPSPLLGAITAERVHLAVAVALLYTLVRFAEAWGLWRHRAWASWLGVIGSAVYVPFEVEALLTHPHAFTVALLAVNLLVVAVLARDLLKRHRVITY